MATIVPFPHNPTGKPKNWFAALKLARLRKLSDENWAEIVELEKTDPLPDNFIDIAKGRAFTPIYSK
ncbi:hypothetical protein AGMMS49944_06900 [Spirochaetia bacterium]|nr:hypothetical protein AGMMS49944_06900 [Spirochaetia bacterium]